MEHPTGIDEMRILSPDFLERFRQYELLPKLETSHSLNYSPQSAK
jgi:hypothetical protein